MDLAADSGKGGEGRVADGKGQGLGKAGYGAVWLSHGMVPGLVKASER